MATPDSAFNPVTLRSKLLGLVAIVALAWSVYEGVSLRLLSDDLQTASAPRRVISLALAPAADDGRRILDEWHCPSATPPCSTAHQALHHDTRFVIAYVLAWVAVAVWARVAGGVSRTVVRTVCAVLIAGGGLDLAENWLLGLLVGNARELPFAWVAPIVPGLGGWTIAVSVVDDQVFTLVRLAAMTKFVVLLIGMAAATLLAGGALRLFIGARRNATVPLGVGGCSDPLTSFEELMRHETSGIFAAQPGRPRDAPRCVVHPAADEGYVVFREADLIGLSLSGGGIRSATFNLGLLQGLHAHGLLRLFDYLSTVSGGGYVGSFWSAWLARQRTQPGTTAWDANLFPDTAPGSGPAMPGTAAGRRVDSDQARHLREFSGFLAPRWGFFEVETWTAIVALLAGLVPALLIGLSAIGITLVAWLALTFPLASRGEDAATALAVGAISLVVFHLFEKMWQEFRRESAGHSSTTVPAGGSGATLRYWLIAGMVVAIAMALQYTAGGSYARGWGLEFPMVTWAIDRPVAAPAANGLARWWVLAGIDNPSGDWTLSPRLFDYGLVWLLTGMLLILVRTSSAVAPRAWPRDALATFDRVLMRVLGMSAAWLGLAALWHLVINLPSLISVVVGTVVSAGVFAALRNWIGVALRRPAEAGTLDRLKPLLPSLLAYLTLVLAAVATGAVLVGIAGTDWYRWWTASALMIAVLVMGAFISPDEFGLHAFYRDRIARAYAGATNLQPGEGAVDNRGSEPRDGDDLPFSSLVARPLHLVCCAANDLSGDQVETLGRGARSAVLSKHGFSLGQHARPWQPNSPGNRLASGITASAAAFNSNMGHISVRVGPAVSFLMTMLNLRLGLWVRHPLAQMAGLRRWPGLLFYREMLGLTSASGRMAPDDVPKSVLRDIHLSDGAHFENLAFYELVRRHCRYILLSDCGADPEVAFDDLGNALRRVREDFGVDVELDVSALRPGPDGRSRQHVAVGTIRYSATDVGILLYVKPTVTGDEPPDVLQYRTRNTDFPHEATSDQFYDEAQWESYRRLGAHAAEQIFDYLVHRDSRRPLTADFVFSEARQRWGPTPAGLEDRILEMTKRFAALDQELQQRRVYGVLRDVFPEMRYIPDAVRAHDSDAGPTRRPEAAAGGESTAHDVIAAELSVLMRVTQLMEDVWASCELDRWWRHPLNLGWINLFARWATSAPFQFWWPLMAPMFGPGFRRFIAQRFPVRGAGGDAAILPHAGQPRRILEPRGSGLAALWWQERSTQPLPWSHPPAEGCTRVFYENVVRLPRAGVDVPVQAALVAVTSRGPSVGWTSDHFFVPPSLWGAGIGGHFVDALLDELRKAASLCHVIIKAPRADEAHLVARDDRQGFLEQYRRIGFRETRPDLPPAAGDEAVAGIADMALCAALGYTTGDTLLTYDLNRRTRDARSQE